MNPNIAWTNLGITFWSSIFHSNFYDLPLSLCTNICNILTTVLILYFLASWCCICKIRFQINDYPRRIINTFTWICSMTKFILEISNNQIFSSASWYAIIYSVTSPFTTSCFYWYWQHICYRQSAYIWVQTVRLVPLFIRGTLHTGASEEKRKEANPIL
jgi:uncharacterized integral membrane protein